MDEREKQQKILEFEKFIDEKLKVDLEKLLQQRDKIYEEIAKYLDLKSKIEMLDENNMKELKTKVNLGSEFYVKAKVPDTSRLFVNVGLGFHVEFTHAEALKFIELKEKHLTRYADAVTEQASSIKARIKMMYHGISELLGMPIEFDED